MKTLTLNLLLSVMLFVCAEGHAVMIFDLQDDYSSTINTATSTWSYRSGLDSAGRDGNYALLPTPPGSGADTNINYSPLGTPMPVWNANTTSTFPLVGKNETGVPQSAPAAFVWQPEDVILHPSTGIFVVASWLSPSDGELDLSFAFTKAQDPDGGDGINWFVEINDQLTTLASGSLGGGVGETSGLQSLNNLNINDGDRVNLIVQSFGNLFRDTTRVEATLSFTPIPEPTTIALALLGFSSLIVRQRS